MTDRDRENWRQYFVGIALGLVCAASIFAKDWTWRGALLGGLAALFCGAILARRPGIWFGGFCAATLLLPPLPVAIGNAGPHLALLPAAAGLAGGVLRWRSWRFSTDSLALPTLFLTLWLAGSSALAFGYSGASAGLGSLLRTGLFGITALAYLDLRHGPAAQRSLDLRQFVGGLFLAATLSGLFACLDFSFQWPPPAGFAEQYVWMPGGSLRRAQGFFYEAGQFGNFCVFFLTGAAVVGLHRWGREQPLRRWLPLTMAVILSAGLILSFSRSAMLHLIASLTVAAALFAPRFRSARWPVWFLAATTTAAVLVVGLAPTFTAAYSDRFQATLTGMFLDPASVLGPRLESWALLLDFLAENPQHLLLGVGFKTLPYSDVAGQPIVPDNMFLSLLLETGLAGLLLALGWLFAILAISLRIARSSSGTAQLLGAWSFCFWIGQIVQMFWVDLLTYWRVLPIYLGMLALAEREAERRT